MSTRKKPDRSTSPKISMPAKPRYKLGQNPAFLQAMAEAGKIPAEEMALAFIELRRRIGAEFPLSPAPAYRLANALVDDSWGQVDEAFPDDWQEESWSDWSEISDAQIALCPVFFCFAPPEVSPYYTPRWMLWVLDAIERRHSLDSLCGQQFIWWLLRHRAKRWLKSGFSAAQIAVLEDFLSQIKNDPDYAGTITLIE